MGDEAKQAIRAILAGAIEGAEAAAQEITAATSTALDEVKAAVVRAFAASSAPQAITGTGSASLSSITARGRAHTAAATLTISPALAAAAARASAVTGLIVPVTMGVGAADVASAADELSVIRRPDPGKLAGRPVAGWSRQELVLNSLFLVIVVYWMLPASDRPALTDIAGLVQGVDAVMALLRP